MTKEKSGTRAMEDCPLIFLSDGKQSDHRRDGWWGEECRCSDKTPHSVKSFWGEKKEA